MAWQLQEAKNKLSEVVKAAKEGSPQFITVRGQDAAVVLSVEEYRRLKSAQLPLSALFAKAPKFDLVIDRSGDVDRPFEL
jgi:prevent-host-death family protein